MTTASIPPAAWAVLAIVLSGVLLSSWATEWIGIHFIFGAFVFGVIMPRQQAADLTHAILESIEQVSVLLLLPVLLGELTAPNLGVRAESWDDADEKPKVDGREKVGHDQPSSRAMIVR